MKLLPLPREKRRLLEPLGRAALTCLLTAGSFGGLCAPLPLAITAAAGPGLPGLCCVLGCGLGAFLFLPFQAGLRQLAAAILIFSGSIAFFDTKFFPRRFFRPGLAAALLLLVQSAYLIARPIRLWALCVFCMGLTAAVTDLLLRRRDRLMPRFEAYCRKKGYEFRAPLTEIYDLCALEYAFSFWQWGSNSYEIPATSATDDELFDYFIGAVDPEYFVRETPTTSFFVQAARELGYYGYDTRPLRKYLSIRNSKDYLRRIFLPDELRDLDFDRTLYRRMHRYLKREDPNMVMIYGANDPWTASGAAWVVTPRKRNMKLFVQPGGSHRTRIATLPEPMREEAIAAIRGWLE